MTDDHMQQQIVDLQQRVTALEQTPPEDRPAGAGPDLVQLVIKAAVGVITAATAAKQPAPSASPREYTIDGPSEAAPRRGGLAESLRRAREAREEQIAAQRPAQPQDGAPLLADRDFTVGERKPMFPIAEPAAPYAGRTAPRRTLPPEAPVRLWNRDYTDHLDVIGRAASGGLDGVQRVRVRDDHADAARQWLCDRITNDEHVFVSWADRPWSFMGYGSGGATGPLSLDLLPLPKPPRVQAVAHPDTAHANIINTTAPEAYTIPDHLGTVPEYGEPVGTVTSGLIHTTPERCEATFGGHQCGKDSGHGGRHAVPGPGGGLWDVQEPTPAPDVDEVLPMPGGPNDKLSQAARPAITFHSNGKVARAYADNSTTTALGRTVEFTDEYVRHWVWDRPGSVSATWEGRRWKVDSIEYDPDRGGVATVELRPWNTPDAYTDLHQRLDTIHDAVNDEDDQ